MSATNPPVDPAFEPKERRHNLTVLLRALPAQVEMGKAEALADIRMRISQVTGAKPFLDAGEQALANEWLAAARQTFDQLLERKE